MTDFKKVTIIGLGLIGGSLGLALKNIAEIPEVWGVVRRQEALKEAVDSGAVDRATLSLEEGLDHSELAFICTPVGNIIDKIKEISSLATHDIIITDVGSSKQSIVAAGEKYLTGKACFIGGHPMTGSEKTGLDAARVNLFENTQYILTPTEKTNLQTYKRLHSLILSLGANVIAIDPVNHDRFMANISHIPHLLSAALVNMVNRLPDEKENLLMLAAGGFRDVTRIAAGDPSMWQDICFDNKEAIVTALENLKQEIEKIKISIEISDENGLYHLLEEAQHTRLNLPTAIHKEPGYMTELFIPVSDQPGVISDITLALGKMGINISDIELLHSSPTSAILKLLILEKENSNKAKKVLEDKGYEVIIETIPE